VVVDLGGVELGDVERLADHVGHVAQHPVADRHGQAGPQVAHRRAPREPVGGPQADGTHPGLADLLGNLGRHGDVLAIDGDGHVQRGVDGGHGVGRELDVDHRAGDGDDPAVLERGPAVGAGVGDGHFLCS
jgi:hypothetical protein